VTTGGSIIQNFSLGGHMASAEREPITGVSGTAEPPAGSRGTYHWSDGQRGAFAPLS